MNPPKKPFDGYKWLWAVRTCTEGLNTPPVLLGVLRAMRRHRGEHYSGKSFYDELVVIENNIHTRVTLARKSELDPTSRDHYCKRNLIRNSGQYWKALDLIGDTRGLITLTRFGEEVADGQITQSEFAATVVKTLQLPNKRIEADVSEWTAAGLEIKPLQLILQIMSALGQESCETAAYLTPFELVKIVIPLAGTKASIQEHAEAILLYRDGKLDLSAWPDCAPADNDERMAREFLLFLANYGFCKAEDGDSRNNERYCLSAWEPQEIESLVNLKAPANDSLKTTAELQKTGLPENADRRRMLVEVLARPEQRRFRKCVFSAYGERCLVTGVTFPCVLEAAHILPVSNKGTDTVDNGLCLRADIHILFDSGHLRIDPVGNLTLTPATSSVTVYKSLSRKIQIPSFVNRDHVEWRWNYK